MENVRRTLLLNADYTPHDFITDISAVVMMIFGRAEIVSGLDGKPSSWEDEICTPNLRFKIPATLRLTRKVARPKKPPRFRKKALFNRDNWLCQFCGSKLTGKEVTIDHILPSSRGGKTSWSNCVTACKVCNKNKSNKTPEEAGMALLKKPAVPDYTHFWDKPRDVWHPDWTSYVRAHEK